jgi:Tol biopolymer transport system component
VTTVLLPLLLLLASDPSLGVWRFNVEKSTYESSKPPQTSIRRWEKDGDWVVFIHRGVDSQGREFHVTFKAKYDGQDYPVKGSSRYDRVSLKMIDGNTVEQLFKKGDEVTVRTKRKISPDGKTMTIYARGQNRDGKPFKNTLVYDRETK